MTIALELHGVRKRFIVGAGTCRAFADVLRGVDLVAREGECLVVVGPRGSGKTTLMLCAAGLLTADAGELRWFGESSRASAGRRVLYHRAGADLIRAGSAGESHVHLLDVAGVAEEAVAFDAWVGERCNRGDVVVVASRDDTIGRRLGARVLTLRAGQLHATAPARARVAEARAN